MSPGVRSLALSLLLPAAVALAQAGRNPLEEVDPDVGAEEEADPEEDLPDLPPTPAPVTSPAPGATGATGATGGAGQPPAPRPRPGVPEVDPLLLPVKPKPVESRPLPVGPPGSDTPVPGPRLDPSRQPPAPLRVVQASNAQLLELWERWRKAVVDVDPKAQEQAQQELLRLKEDLGIQDLEPFAVGFLRQAEARRRASDPVGEVHLARTAVQLSPHLPAAHFALAEAHLRADLSAVGPYLSELKEGLYHLWTDPRHARPALADLGSGLLFALVATATAAVLMLFARRVRYFVHDFHHLLPRVTASWQSAALAVLLLSLPVVFRLGVAPLLLVLLASVCIYLSPLERAVAAALVASLGLLPRLAFELTEHTALAGTLAEDVYRLERGGLEAEPAAARVRKRVGEGRAEFAELFALGRFQLRRGQVDGALEHFKLAAAKRASDARLLTNVGNAMMAKEDTDGAADMYKTAAQADGTLAAPLFNVSKLYSRRARVLRDELVAQELEKSHAARERANQLDPRLARREDPPEDDLVLNRFLLSPELPEQEVLALASAGEQAEKVSAQLSSRLLGSPGWGLLWPYPIAGAALLFALGFAARSGAASRACDRCGRPVCRRCDPDLPASSELCGQCVNVFVRRNAVTAPTKVRKQLEVDYYQARMGRLSYLFGLLCSGAGHFFSGLPLRGALYSFLFLFVAFSAFYRHGVLRPPYDAGPSLLRLLPLGATFVLVYLLSLRGLYKRQAE
jgi:Flp pilus assembly protein TadD